MSVSTPMIATGGAPIATSSPTTSIATVAAASFVGTAIEWYDFFLYGTSAVLIFPKLFFPASDPIVGTLLALATFAAGFLARPIGGVVFGHYGDRLGRKAMLSLTLGIMGTATFAIGILPTYASIGIAAPILLLVLRLLQGFGLGGEWGGAVLMVAEHAPSHRRGFYAALPQVGAAAGSLVANGVFFLSGKGLTADQFTDWGWRIPFLLSALLVGVGTFVRLRVAETPAFEKIKERNDEARMPLVEVLRAHKRSVLLALGARLAENVFFYIYTVTVLGYVTVRTGLPKDTVLRGVLIAMGIDLVAIPMFGALSDKLGRRPVYLFGAIFSAVFVGPFFLLVDTGQPGLICLAIVLGVCVGHAAMYGPQASFLSELFGARVRYTGASLGYQLASVFGGGLAPLIATALFAWAHGVPSAASPRASQFGWWAVALYMVGCAAVTIIAVLAAAETHKRRIET